MINKIFLLILIAFNCTSAQINTEEIFKMQLYLNIKKPSVASVENYKRFSDLTNLKIDTLKTQNNLTGSLQTEFVFFRVKESEITYNSPSAPNYLACSPLRFYILGINLKSGASYRLAGFESNDFINFYNDFRAKYVERNFKHLKIKRFIKNYKVENLDFECLYDGLKNIDAIDRIKHPCLQKCEDLFKIN